MAAKKKALAQRKPVPRHTRKYQFRNNHPQDQHVEDILDFWKQGRREITNLRKAIELYYALEQGELTALFDMFPQYKDQFAPNGLNLIEQFQAMLQQVRLPAADPQPVSAGPRALNAPALAMPVFEDDDQDTIILHKSTSTDAASNFINAMKGLLQ
mgnify:FL=1